MSRQEYHIEGQFIKKLKDVFGQYTYPYYNTTFNFAQPYIAMFVADKLTINTIGLNFDK